jgi:hypothetical protein
MKGIVDIRVVDDAGHHHILVSQQSNFGEADNARVAETLRHLGKIQQGREIALNVMGVKADGTVAEAGEMPARWDVSYLIRVPDGYRGSTRLLSFDNQEAANKFARNLLDAFGSGRTIRLEDAGPQAREAIQSAPGSVVQLTAAKANYGSTGPGM